jgi:hypothetical protein
MRHAPLTQATVPFEGVAHGAQRVPQVATSVSLAQRPLQV